MRDQPDLDHDVAGAEAGEIERRSAICRAICENIVRQPQMTGMTEQHRAVEAGDPERRPDQQIAPLVLQEFEPVE